MSCTEAFLNVLLKNDFYAHEKQNSQNKIMIQQIIEEIEYYNSSEFETFELKNFLHYFQFYLIYFKYQNLSVFFYLKKGFFYFYKFSFENRFRAR